jgi:subtilisin family serine protease
MRPTRRVRLRVSLAVLTFAVGLTAPSAALAEEPPAFPRTGSDVLARDSWIVTLAPGWDARAEAAGLARSAGGDVGLVYAHALNGFQLKGSGAAAEALRRNPIVASVEADRPLFLTETLPFGVERIDAWTFTGDGAYQVGFRGTGARIAILDTGIDLDHPDLAASIDNASGLNCLNSSLPPNDGHGHGTHVSGTAAAPLNGVGVVGVAPEATLVAIKMFDDAGNSSLALSLCALDRVVALNTDASDANDVDVASMSWGEHRTWGTCATDALHGAICRASVEGVVLVAGAGNDARDAGSFVPAAYPEVISVSGFSDFNGQPGGTGGCQWVLSLGWYECDDTFAFFSDFGASVDVMAPAVNVHSTWAGGGYNTIDGTSMATPHVAGVVALMAAADSDLTPAEALDALRTTGECPNGAPANADGSAGCAGQGTWPDDPDGIAEPLVSARRAAEAVAGTPPPPPPPPPNPTAPAAPTLASATGGVSSISLSWTTPADGGSPITGYEIWRGTAAGGESLLTTAGVQQGYEDSDVDAGTTYWYQVAAVNAIGASARSNELSAALIEPASAPTLLGAPADGAVALSWTEPADDGGSSVTGYNVYRRVGSGTEGLLGTTGASETSYVDYAVTNGTQYTYRVAAVTAAGEGALSNAVAVTPTSSVTAPDPPRSLTAGHAKGNTAGIVLKWTAPVADGGSPIASYFVYRKGPGETVFTLIGLTNASTRTYTDTTVARRTTYTYAVTAFNTYYESAQSNAVTFRSK